MLLAGAIILLSGGTLGLAFEDGMGVATVFRTARAQLYEEQTTGVPIEQSYIVNGVEFDGYDGFALIDAKGPGYANPIKGQWSNEPKSTYRTDPVTGEVKRVKKGLLQIGKDQVKAVRATGLPGVFRTLLVFLLQAAFVKFRSSRSTSLGARYPRAE